MFKNIPSFFLAISILAMGFSRTVLVGASHLDNVVGDHGESMVLENPTTMTNLRGVGDRQQEGRKLSSGWQDLKGLTGLYEFTSAIYVKMDCSGTGPCTEEPTNEEYLRCYHDQHLKSNNVDMPNTYGNTNANYYWKKVIGTDKTNDGGCTDRWGSNGGGGRKCTKWIGSNTYECCC